MSDTTVSTEQRRSTFERSIETQQLYKRLLTMNDGDVVPYDELNAIIGDDVQNGARAKLATARQAAYHETKRVYAIVPKIGVKRLTADECSGALSSTVQQTHRRARKAFRQSADMPFEEMSGEAQQAVTLSRTLLHFVAESTSPKKQKALTDGLGDEPEGLGFVKTLQLFAEK